MAVRKQAPLFVTIACCLAAGCLFFAPPEFVALLRGLANDALAPGQKLLTLAIPEQVITQVASADREETDMRQSQLVSELNARLRQRTLEVIALRKQLQTQKTSGRFPVTLKPVEPLIVPQLLPANVLSHSGGDVFQSVVIDKGKADISSEAPVLSTQSPVIDQGEDQGVDTGQAIFSGRTVVGRVQQTGRWTSSVQLVTDSGYSGKAQLIRNVAGRIQRGPKCILEGHGDGTCRLMGIAATEPVAVGDEVYTSPSGPFDGTMYYGQVVKAQLNPGSIWEIVVRPAFKPGELRNVVVLRRQLNPNRIAHR